MKMRTLPSMAALLALVAVGGMTSRTASADTIERTKEVTTTTHTAGTVTEIAPSSSTIVLKSESSPEPMRYTFTQKTTFVDPAGKVVSYEAIRNQPVTVFYSKDGDQQVVSKVVVSKPPASITTEKKTTTTTQEIE